MLENNKYIIYGVGNVGKRIARMMKRTGLTVELSDGNARLWNEVIDGQRVIPSVEIVTFILQQIKNSEISLKMIVCINDDQEKDFIKYMGKYIEVISWRDILDDLLEMYDSLNVPYTSNYLAGFERWWYGLRDEIDFWENAYAQKGARKHNWYLKLVENRKFQDPFLSITIKDGMKILDVGSGIVSRYGNEYKNINVDVQAVDPLAFWYNAFNHKYNEKYEKKDIQFGLFETLASSYEVESQDLIIISNALDHCIDPYESVRQALQVLKIGGVLYIKSLIREGCNEKFSGLHQWNIDIDKNGEFIIWDDSNYVNVTRNLSGFCSMRIKKWDSDERGLKGEWGFCTIEIEKLKTFNRENENENISNTCKKIFRKLVEENYYDRKVWEQAYNEIEKQMDEERLN